MKYLILSDLHISTGYVNSVFHIEKYKRILKDNIKTDYDVVLISGDVFENFVTKYVNVFEVLENMFDHKPVIFCLGNHEFAYGKFENVLKTYRAQYEIYKDKFPDGKVICLDVSGFADFENCRIVGNVFWYDWSLNHCRVLMKGEIAPGWLDETIQDFDAIKANKECKKQIFKSLSDTKKHILLTHMVPHERLNAFSIENPTSPYNAHSGVADFLNEIKDKNFKFAFCGHTHRRTNLDIYGIKCLNIGNDYYFHTMKIEWAMFDLNKDLEIKDFKISEK